MNIRSSKRAYGAATLFYFLVVVEFFYMASPFALYFYSAYQPALSWLGHTPALAWTADFFLPHIVLATTSPLIDLHNAIGAVLAAAGFAAFCIGAAQVYHAKLTGRGPVTGGIYTVIRHPQYAALIACSFGLLLLWPRYLVLVGFVTMSFAYYLLARIEEQECERKFGAAYAAYREATGMFFPRWRARRRWHLPLPTTRRVRLAAGFGAYVAALVISFGVALGVEHYAVNSLFTVTTDDGVYVSVTEMAPDRMASLARAALADERVQARLEVAHDGQLLNYIAPVDLFVSEIPMSEQSGPSHDHFLRAGSPAEAYKIIFTRAVLPDGSAAEGCEILRRVIERVPLAEVWLDPEARVLQVLPPPAESRYAGIPMPVM